MAQERSDTGIKSVKNAFDIIEYLRTAGPSTATQVSEALDVPLSTAHIYLKTLRDVGYVRRDDSTYRIGLRFLDLGGFAQHDLQLYHAAKPEVDNLAAETEEVANLGVEENGMRVLLHKSEPPEGVYDNPHIGQFTNMHWTSLGKAILSQLDDDRVAAIVDRHGLPRATPNTITSLDTLSGELADIRERGYSIEDEEREEGIRALGVPVSKEASEAAVGAISVSGPRNRILDREDEIVEALRNTANIIELRYKHY